MDLGLQQQWLCYRLVHRNEWRLVLAMTWEEQRREMTKRCNDATPGPHQTRFIYRLLKAVRDNAATLGLLLDSEDNDWADANLWSHAQEDIAACLARVDAQEAESEGRRKALVEVGEERRVLWQKDEQAEARIAELERENSALQQDHARLVQSSEKCLNIAEEKIEELERENAQLHAELDWECKSENAVRALAEALEKYADENNWRCPRCGKADQVNCYMCRWIGPDKEHAWDVARAALALPGVKEAKGK